MIEVSIKWDATLGKMKNALSGTPPRNYGPLEYAVGPR